jgi:hypothetical protein
VQVSEPTEPLATYFVRVEVVNASGPRKQTFMVRAPKRLAQTDFLDQYALDTARTLGFVPTGWVGHE